MTLGVHHVHETAHPELVEGQRLSQVIVCVDSGFRRNDEHNPLPHAWGRVRVGVAGLGKPPSKNKSWIAWIPAFAGMTDGIIA